MGRWRTRAETWLVHEQSGRNDEAEAAFCELFTALPAEEVSPVFVARTAGAAWRAHRVTSTRQTWVRAAVLVTAASLVLVAGYAVLGLTAGSLVPRGVALLTGGTVQVLKAGATALQWWSAAASAGTAVAGLAALPQAAAVLAAIELAGIVALYLLHRLLRGGFDVRAGRSYCF